MAVAGIAATALVGLAATGTAWLSARDDRATQRALARDERTYERRVSAYLDSVSLVETQDRALFTYMWHVGAISHEESTFLPDGGTLPLLNSVPGRGIPFDPEPSIDLTRRLRVFGSTQMVELFEKVERTAGSVAVSNARYETPRETANYVVETKVSHRTYRQIRDQFLEFHDQVSRLEQLIHGEVGT